MKKKINKLFEALVKTNDTPQRTALGFGLGVFLGVLPGTGPIASLIAASFLRLNRASALLGSLATNTWISLVLFLPAVKVGAFISGASWLDALRDWKLYAQQFRFINLFKISLLKMILPVLLGYFLMSFCVGVAAYLAAFVAVKIGRHAKIFQAR